MKFDLSAMIMGELIRFKDKLLETKKITKDEYNAITRYLTFIINEEN